MLFANDAALAAHSEEQLQSLMDGFSRTCQDFSLTISLKKTNVEGPGRRATSSNNHQQLRAGKRT